jgi:hypothetical protein
MTKTEQDIERRIILEQVSERVPVVADLIAEHGAAVEACRLAAGVFSDLQINVDADPLDGAAQDLRERLQTAIEAVRGIAERYA